MIESGQRLKTDDPKKQNNSLIKVEAISMQRMAES